LLLPFQNLLKSKLLIIVNDYRAPANTK